MVSFIFSGQKVYHAPCWLTCGGAAAHVATSVAGLPERELRVARIQVLSGSS